MSLFCGIVGSYDQKTKKHEVLYEDKSKLQYSADAVREMISTFELWYARVSCGGRTMSRKKASPYIVKAHRKKQIQDKAEAGAVDLTVSAAAAAATTEEETSEAAVRMAVNIKKMKVSELRALCAKEMLNESGLKAVLQQRLMEHYKCQNILQETTKGKHKCVWKRKKFDATPTPFTDQGFNEASLKKHLPSFAQGKMPSQGECYDFFMTEEMWNLGLGCTNNYPRQIRSQMQPPPWHNPKMPWPPLWTEKPWVFNMEQFKTNTAVLYKVGSDWRSTFDVRRT